MNKIEKELRDYAMSFPETTEEFPWGHRSIKVKKKAFLFMNHEGEGISFSVKLPQSADFALDLPFTEPTAYGLGKANWVTARVVEGTIDIAVLKEWIRESFMAVAPKKVSAALTVP